MKAKKIAALCLASVLLLSGCGGKTVDGKSVVASTSEVMFMQMMFMIH